MKYPATLVAGPGTSSHCTWPNDTFDGPTVTFVTMHTPAVPAVRPCWELTTIAIELGAITVITLFTDWVPTVSVMVADPGVLGAVHVNVALDALAAGVPPVAVHVPAAEPVKSTTSPTAIVVRTSAALGAVFLVFEVSVGGGAGAAAASPVGALLRGGVATGPGAG